jgi:hypothetical protein
MDCDSAFARHGDLVMEIATYRLISSVVAACCLAPLAFAGLAIPEAIVVSGLVLILASVASIQIYRHQHKGRRLVIVACVIAIMTGLGIPYWHHWNYESETQPGYRRENFEKLASNKEQLGSLVGQSLCLKGQVVFGSSNFADEQTFLFAPRSDSFGTIPILRIELTPNTTWHTTADRVAVSGILAENELWRGDLEEPRYVLYNAIVRRSRTHY